MDDRELRVECLRLAHAIYLNGADKDRIMAAAIAYYNWANGIATMEKRGVSTAG